MRRAGKGGGPGEKSLDERDPVTEMSRLYREGQLREGSPAPGLEKFRVGG